MGIVIGAYAVSVRATMVSRLIWVVGVGELAKYTSTTLGPTTVTTTAHKPNSPVIIVVHSAMFDLFSWFIFSSS